MADGSIVSPENFSHRIGSREREREREKGKVEETKGRGEGAGGAGRLMHNLSRPEQEEGVSQLGLTGPEMEIARRNFIRPRTFSRTNRTFTLSSRVLRDIRCSGWVITIWLFLYFNALMTSFVIHRERISKRWNKNVV